MSVDIACPQCKGILKAPPGMAGKKARCKRCQHAFRIPGGEPGAEDSVSDSQDLSVVADAPFAFDAPAEPPPAAKKPAAKPAAAAADNPFAIPTVPPAEVDEPTPEPKSKSKSKYKTKSDSSAKTSSYRGKAVAPPARGRSIKFLLAALLCAVGGAGGFYAYSEYQKSQTQSAAVAKAAPSEATPAVEAAKPNDDKAKKTTAVAQTAPSAGSTAPDRRTNSKAARGGPKVSGGLKLPPFADKPKPFEKALATIALDHDAASVRQVMLGGEEGPVILVTRRTFDGLGGKGMKDTIDRYALNTLRRIDQTEVPADAVTAYPRIGHVGPGGDRFAFEHPVGKLTVVQLGTKTVLVDGLDLAGATDGPDKAPHPGIAAIYFLTDEKLLIVTKAGVVESWDLTGKKKVGASEAIPGAANLVDRRSLAFHRNRDPSKSLVFAYAGGTIHSVSPGAKPQPALTLPHGPTDCLALATDHGGNRLAVAYRAAEPGEHVRFLHGRIGDPKPGSDQPLDAEVGVPKFAEWTRPETFSVMTDKGQGLAWDADANHLIAGFRTPAPTIVAADGAKHWCLLPDAKDAKKAVLVNVIVPPEDYSPSLTGDKWKAMALTITAEGTAK
jgi:hypothetical protein